MHVVNGSDQAGEIIPDVVSSRMRYRMRRHHCDYTLKTYIRCRNSSLYIIGYTNF